MKRRQNRGHGEVLFVKPSDLFDPRNELLKKIFDKDRSCFPVDEFETEDSLKILEEVGLQTAVDKDIFLKCAWTVEEERSISKAMKLFEYFNENFGSFVDNHRGEFIHNLAEISCVPANNNQSLTLCRFRDAGKFVSYLYLHPRNFHSLNLLYFTFPTAAPKDRHLAFTVMPIIHNAATPPQVLFSSLGIVSPPPISVVLRQLRTLIENEGTLDHWNYKHGTVETVFSDIFSFLQGEYFLMIWICIWIASISMLVCMLDFESDNYVDLSPRVQDGLKDKAIVPIGTNLVKTNRLFFRLTKDLSPFFYEVPRGK